MGSEPAMVYHAKALLKEPAVRDGANGKHRFRKRIVRKRFVEPLNNCAHPRFFQTRAQKGPACPVPVCFQTTSRQAPGSPVSRPRSKKNAALPPAGSPVRPCTITYHFIALVPKWILFGHIAADGNQVQLFGHNPIHGLYRRQPVKFPDFVVRLCHLRIDKRGQRGGRCMVLGLFIWGIISVCSVTFTVWICSASASVAPIWL